MRQIFFALLIVVGHLVDGFTVHIIDQVPNNPTPLTLRCQSKDDDIGTHTLYTGQEIKWSFKLNPFGRTLFFCHFYWGSKDTSFTVYDKRIRDDCRRLGGIAAPRAFDVCYWEARTDGFYVSGDTIQWEKINNWP
ncbi:hypothetical protein U1Q18_037055 [Sarracenia purpurea var. burkii]